MSIVNGCIGILGFLGFIITLVAVHESFEVGRMLHRRGDARPKVGWIALAAALVSGYAAARLGPPDLGLPLGGIAAAVAAIAVNLVGSRRLRDPGFGNRYP